MRENTEDALMNWSELSVKASVNAFANSEVSLSAICQQQLVATACNCYLAFFINNLSSKSLKSHYQ